MTEAIKNLPTGIELSFKSLPDNNNHFDSSFDYTGSVSHIQTLYFLDQVSARINELKTTIMLQHITAEVNTNSASQIKSASPPPVKINIDIPPREQSFIDASNDVGVPPREQFFIDERKIETLSAPPGTSYIRCIIRLKRDEAIYIVHQLELDTDTDFAYAVKLLIADVDKHASSISEQLHKKLLNGEYVSHE